MSLSSPRQGGQQHAAPQGCLHPLTVQDALAEHFKLRSFRVAVSKRAATITTDAAGLAMYPFWTPPAWPNLGVISIDLDRPAAGLDLHAAVVLPHVVIETDRGAQGCWLIDRVHTGDAARPGPLAYAEDVARALRAALDGDPAVDPLRPARVRNPGYLSHDVRTTARPLSEPWRLGELRTALVEAGQWPERSRALPSVASQPGVFAGRNDAVNRSTWLTVRHALEAGTVEQWTEADVLAVACRVNQEVAQAERVQPLPEQEVRHLAASITRHQHRPGRRGKAGSETARALGAKGGAVRSEAKTASGRQNVSKATAVRSAESALRAESIRILAEQGYTHVQIAQQLGCSTKTVQRAMRSSRGVDIS